MPVGGVLDCSDVILVSHLCGLSDTSQNLGGGFKRKFEVSIWGACSGCVFEVWTDRVERVLHSGCVGCVFGVRTDLEGGEGVAVAATR